MSNDKPEFRCIVVPWWYYASKWAALMLLIDGLAMLWVAVLGYYGYYFWQLLGFSFLQLLAAAVSANVVKQ
jgi:hypothetical protein